MMNRKLIAIALAGATPGCMAEAPPDMAAVPVQPMSASAEAKLERELRGRVAGAPMPCVGPREVRGSEAIGTQLILFQGRTSDTVYLNRLHSACGGLRHGRTLITNTYSTGRLCAGDIARIVDPVTGAGFGSCPLGEFTPYRR